MDLVGPTRVCPVGGSHMSLWLWTTTLAMLGCSFYPTKVKHLALFEIWSLGWKMRDMVTPFELYTVIMTWSARTLILRLFCGDLCLDHQFSSPYVVWHNGVVERKKFSLCEMARTMLNEHRTPRRYWVEGVNTACHVGITFSFMLSWRRRAISSCMGKHLELAIFQIVVACTLFSRRGS
jgi:hypothetical protein